MAVRDEPSVELAERVLPAPLLRALRHIFQGGLPGCMLAGGSALAGFYAGHRKSDDLDLFTSGPQSQKATVLAVRSLAAIGTEVETRHESATYMRAICRLDGHRFTADAAATPRVFEIGRAVLLPGDMAVANFETLLTLKAAALVSRCAEKDLYDLLWILERRKAMTLSDLVAAAQRFDAGCTPEGLLISLTGARLDKESCGFGLGPKAAKPVVFREVSRFRDALLKGLRALAKNQPPPPIAEIVNRVRRLSRGAQ